MKPAVSVIMPVFDAAGFVGASIASVFRQIWTDWELIAVDDGSRDGSHDIVASWVRRDSRIRLLRQENAGPAAARNTGCIAARGRFLAFLDSDDLWHPCKLERQLQNLRDTGAPLSCTGYRWIDEMGNPLPVVVRPPRHIPLRDMLGGNRMGCLTVMLDSTRTGIPRFESGTRHEDYRLWLNLMRRLGPACGLRQCLALYRIRSGSFSSRKLSVARDTWRILRSAGRLDVFDAPPFFMRYAYRSVHARMKSKFGGT